MLLEIPTACLRFIGTFRRMVGIARRRKRERSVREQDTAEEGGHEGGREWADRRSHGERGESAARRPQGRLCASKPWWIYRTTHSVVRCSRHGAIRHVPKRCRSPAVARSQTVTPLWRHSSF